MKVGADRNKVIALSVLVVIAAYLMYTNVISPESPGGEPQSAPVRPASLKTKIQEPADPAASVAPAPAPAPNVSRAPNVGRRGNLQEWVPSLKQKKGEQRDPNIDPTLRLDVLTKLSQVTISGGSRSLFDFGQPPPPPVPQVKITPAPVAAAPAAPPPAPTGPPSPPPPPPIPLKFYGVITGPGGKRALFLNGEEILIAGEGQTVQSRYKVVRINVSSAMVEDTQYNRQQSLPLEVVPPTG